VVGIVNVAFIAFISYRVWVTDRSSLRHFYWPALLFKLLAGIGLGLVYTFYYAVGDTFNYFNDGVKLADLARQDAGSYIGFLWSGDEAFPIWTELVYRQPRAMFLSKITSVFCLLTADSYWVTSLYFSAISFFSAWTLAKKILILHDGPFAVSLAFFFFPTAIFWSSGVIKESLAMAALFFLGVIFLQLWLKEKIRISTWLLAFFAMWVLWNLKYYYIAVFFPVAATALFARWAFSRLHTKNLSLKVLLWCMIFLAPLLLISVLHPNFYPERFLTVVVDSYYEFQAISAPGDVIHYNTMEPTLYGIVKNVPLAIFSGLYRPFFAEATTVLQIFGAIENCLLLVLTAAALFRIKKIAQGKHRLVVFSLLIYIVVLCVFLALSTPNFGTLSRYRVGFLPFFVLLLAIKNPLATKLINSKWVSNLAP
jgi:hypothetical protein